jgi:hypothetical protein
MASGSLVPTGSRRFRKPLKMVPWFSPLKGRTGTIRDQGSLPLRGSESGHG